MRANEPVLLVFSAYEVEIILEKGEILCEKRQSIWDVQQVNRSQPTNQPTKKNLLHSSQ